MKPLEMTEREKVFQATLPAAVVEALNEVHSFQTDWPGSSPALLLLPSLSISLLKRTMIIVQFEKLLSYFMVYSSTVEALC